MTLGLWTVAGLDAGSESADRIARAEAEAYLPFVAKPVRTPTATPTATPLPRIPDVRIEGPCSSFKGGGTKDPNGEYVCFKNHDTQTVDMTHWLARDAAAHTYTFPSFALNPGATVKLHSGPGSNTATDLYWGRGLVWNNDHDTVYLYDAFGRLVNMYVY
jgi:competence protein ComEC